MHKYLESNENLFESEIVLPGHNNENCTWQWTIDIIYSGIQVISEEQSCVFGQNTW